MIVYESVLQNSEKEISDNRKSYSDTENLKAKAEKFISENSDTEQKIFDAKSKITALKYKSGKAERLFVEYQNLAKNNAKLTNVKSRMCRPCKVGNGTQQRVQRTAQHLYNEYGRCACRHT